jgi:hypothetical protein
MIIYQRLATFSAPPQEVVPWALEVTEAVNARTTLNTSLWQGLSGGPLGTFAWSALIENLTAAETAFDQLAADAEYLDLAAQAADWLSTPPEDHILRMVHSAGGDYVRPDPGAYAEVTRAVPRGGKLGEAAAFGVEISDRHSALTHSSVLFCTLEYGLFGEMRWLGVYPSAAEVDHAAELVAKDDGYGAALDRAGDLFVEGIAQHTLARRIA